MTDELLKQADEFLRWQKLRVEARGSLARWQIAREIYALPISGDALIKALADELRGKEWQPIETAPKEKGGNILLGAKGSKVIEIGRWDCVMDSWFTKYGKDIYPTKWQPLPQPPKED